MNALYQILENYANAVREEYPEVAMAIAAEAGLDALGLALVPAERNPLDYSLELSRTCAGELFLWTLDPKAREPVHFLQRRDGAPADPALLTGAAVLHARFRHGRMLLVL